VLIAFSCWGRSASAEDAYVLPFVSKERGSPVLVQVTIAGRPRTLLIDTGAPASVFDDAMAKDLGAPLGERVLHLLNGDASAQIFSPRTIFWGDVPLKPKSRVYALSFKDGPHRLSELPFAGILGMDYLREWIVTFDFDQAQVSLSKTLPADASLGQKLPLIEGREDPRITCKVDGADLECVVDTGCIGSLSLSESGFDNLPKDAKSLAFFGSTAGKVCREIEIGPWKHQAVSCDKIERSFSLLGLYALNRYRVTLDVPGGFIYLSPGRYHCEPDHSGCDGAYVSRSGRDEGGICVLAVLDGSIAQQAGLKNLDRLLKVDGKAAEELGEVAIHRIWSQRGSADLRLDIRRNGYDYDPSNDQELTVVVPGNAMPTHP
jgi:hypothetical protein